MHVAQFDPMKSMRTTWPRWPLRFHLVPLTSSIVKSGASWPMDNPMVLGDWVFDAQGCARTTAIATAKTTMSAAIARISFRASFVIDRLRVPPDSGIDLPANVVRRVLFGIDIDA